MSALVWTAEQSSAIERVRAWLQDPRSGTREAGVFRLFGHAGVGKTSLALELTRAVDGAVRFASFTGKAALVMHRKGCIGATTIHRLIYLPRGKCQKRLEEIAKALRTETDPDRLRELRVEHDEERANLSRPSWTLNTLSPLRETALLVIDECSMVGTRMGQDLVSFGVPILALGDPGQLPPVQDRGYFTDPRQEPDILLEEVHRQAAGSPVLALATRARRGQPLEYGAYGESAVVRRRDLPIAAAAEFDQIIVGRNATRRAINVKVREHLGHAASPHLPVSGDRLVCLRNDHEIGLLNGGQWRCLGVEQLDSERVLLTIVDEEPVPGSIAAAIEVEAHTAYFRGDEPPHYEVRKAQCFDFGYCITVHKSQGSQWRSVCVVDEGDSFPGEERRWRYTAITRASERVTIVR